MTTIRFRNTKQLGRQAADELTAELEILNAEKQEAEVAIAYINSEAESSRGEIEENKQHFIYIESCLFQS